MHELREKEFLFTVIQDNSGNSFINEKEVSFDFICMYKIVLLKQVSLLITQTYYISLESRGTTRVPQD